MRVYTLLATFLIVLVTGTTGHASTILFANLTTSQENHPVVPTTDTGDPRPVPSGSATFELNTLMTALTFSATIFDIDVTGTQTADANDNLTAAHIHASATVTPMTNAGVVWGFFGMPLNDVPNEIVIVPFSSGVGGTFSGTWDELEGNNTTLTDQLNNILTGRSYINFHTVQFGAGEIRGAIQVVPEPYSIALLGIGIAVIAFARFRRQASI